jgi:hypothetical protein
MIFPAAKNGGVTMVCKSSPNLAFWTIAQTGKVTPLVSGPPGCGKSRSVEAFARATGRQCYSLIGSLREPAGIGGYPYPDHSNDVPYMRVMPPKWAHDCQHGNWVLFFDELTTCPPPVQAALLGVIAENRVGDATLPDTVWKVAACNPPDCAANGSEIEPPLANRLCHLEWQTNTAAWRRGMANGLCFPEPEFTLLPADWEKCIGRNTSLIAAFHEHKPGLLEAYPKDRAKASGPWPSVRSWTNAAICAAALEAIDAEPLIRYQAISGCVGEEAMLEFQYWESKLDLPDPEEWILKATLSRAMPQVPLGPELNVPPRSDQVMAVLGALTDRVKNYDLADNGKPTERRWLAAVDCYAEVAKTWLELAISAGAPLYGCVPEASVLMKSPMEFTNQVLQVHRNLMGK